MQAPVIMSSLSSLTDQLEKTYNNTLQLVGSANWHTLSSEKRIAEIVQRLNTVSNKVLRYEFDLISPAHVKGQGHWH